MTLHLKQTKKVLNKFSLTRLLHISNFDELKQKYIFLIFFLIMAFWAGWLTCSVVPYGKRHMPKCCVFCWTFLLKHQRMVWDVSIYLTSSICHIPSAVDVGSGLAQRSSEPTLNKGWVYMICLYRKIVLCSKLHLIYDHVIEKIV